MGTKVRHINCKKYNTYFYLDRPYLLTFGSARPRARAYSKLLSPAYKKKTAPATQAASYTSNRKKLSTFELAFTTSFTPFMIVFTLDSYMAPVHIHVGLLMFVNPYKPMVCTCPH